MDRNKPIKRRIVKRTPNFREQIHKAAKGRETQMGEEVKFAQQQLNAGDQRIEELKEQIVTTKRSNNATRVGALAAVAAGTAATNLTILQGSHSHTDIALKYGIVLGACLGGLMMNNYFNKTDITMTEMLKRANAWSRQEFTPEEVQTFKELYDEVKNDFKENPKSKKDVKSNFVFQTSQGVIFSLAIARLASAADKINFVDYITMRFKDENNVLETEFNVPILNSDAELKFPKFD